MTDDEQAVCKDPEATYKLLLKYHELGLTTEMGKWTIQRAEQLVAKGDRDAYAKAIDEATEVWKDLDNTKKLLIM